MTIHWWEEIQKLRDKSKVILKLHFFEKSAALNLFDSKDSARTEAIEAVKRTGEFHPAVGEDEEPHKWYCIFENSKGELLEMPILHRPHLKKAGAFVSIVKSIYPADEFQKNKHKKALNTYMDKYNRSEKDD